MILTKLLTLESFIGENVNTIVTKTPILKGLSAPVPETAPEEDEKSELETKKDALNTDIIKATAQPKKMSMDEEDEDNQPKQAPQPEADPFEEVKKEPPVPVICDEMQVAWENLEAARTITEKELEKTKKDKGDWLPINEILAKIIMRLGDLLTFQGKLDDGLSEYKKALEIREKNAKTESRNLAESYSSIGMVLAAKNKKSAALENLESAKKLICEDLKLALGIKDGEPDTYALINVFIDVSNQTGKKLQDALRGICKKVYFSI